MVSEKMLSYQDRFLLASMEGVSSPVDVAILAWLILIFFPTNSEESYSSVALF